MKTFMSMKWDGVTPEQYDTVRKIVNWEGDPAKGGLLHVAGFTNNSLRVTDIWESADDFNNFVQTRLMPGVMQAALQHSRRSKLFRCMRFIRRMPKP